MATTKVELEHGYVDQEGKHHRNVELRCPTIGDEIEAEKYCIRNDLRGSETALAMKLVERCIVTWDDITTPEMKHLHALSRSDGRALIGALMDLEEDSEQVEMGNFPLDRSSSV